MKEKISMVIFVLVLGTVCTFLLVAINDYTAPIIGKNKRLEIKRNILKVLDIPFSENNIENVFAENIQIMEAGNKKFYVTRNKEVAFEYSGPGLWGQISGILAFMPDLETIRGISVINQEETPGLGGRITEKEFLNSFTGKKFIPDVKILLPGKAKGENEIDGITGATMTGTAFEKMINEEMAEFRKNYVKNNSI